MRVAFIGVSHWHAPLYYRPAARLPRVRIVAVSDEFGNGQEESVGTREYPRDTIGAARRRRRTFGHAIGVSRDGS
jgi:hypothetical protein